MPLSVGLVEGLVLIALADVYCGKASTKVCCWSAWCADGIEASAKCEDWATKVCCGVAGAAKCGEASTKVCCGVEKHGDGWSERFVGW